MEETVKIVLNRCYGGFGLSDKAVLRYAELKGIELIDAGSTFGSANYYIKNSDGSQGEYFSYYDIPRNDPLLIQVVEELGDEADGQSAKLYVTAIPVGARYQISEYDGIESLRMEEKMSWYVAGENDFCG